MRGFTFKILIGNIRKASLHFNLNNVDFLSQLQLSFNVIYKKKSKKLTTSMYRLFGKDYIVLRFMCTLLSQESQQKFKIDRTF